MREIKFRGIDNANDEWIYGSLVKVDEDYHILEEGETQAHAYNRVDKDSIGQYTGLKDKDGKEIYEGDILRYKRNDISEENFKLYWNEEESAFYLQNILYPNDDDIAVKYYKIENFEIIGNIFENKELLKTRG